MISDETVDRLRCRIVAGAANDLLAVPEIADALAERGITYVPDFIANAGGVIHIHALRAGWGDGQLRSEVMRIGERVSELLAAADATGETPLHEAEMLARRRIERAHDAPPVALAS